MFFFSAASTLSSRSTAFPFFFLDSFRYFYFGNFWLTTFYPGKQDTYSSACLHFWRVPSVAGPNCRNSLVFSFRKTSSALGTHLSIFSRLPLFSRERFSRFCPLFHFLPTKFLQLNRDRLILLLQQKWNCAASLVRSHYFKNKFKNGQKSKNPRARPV